ncbi:MAG TPA: hypothetical protein VK775_05415 [Chthoniobacterales bacterium]|jgi:hypothetical protein|nr:hypothetical protein [Chthoniobacterales bacterium]
MLVTSIDRLATCKASGDLIVELVGVIATVDDDSEGASFGHVVMKPPDSLDPLQARSDHRHTALFCWEKGSRASRPGSTVLPTQSIDQLIGVNLFGAHLERIAVRQFALSSVGAAERLDELF